MAGQGTGNGPTVAAVQPDDTPMSAVGAFFLASRAKLLVGSAAHAVLGLVLAAQAFSDLFSAWTGLYVLMHFSIAFMACGLNSWCDRDVDRRYKRELSDAVELLGGRLFIALAVEGTIAAVAITIFLANGYVLAGLSACFGIVVAFAYSAEPVRLKGRGFVSPFPLWIALYVLPIPAGWSVLRSDFPGWLFVFMVGYAFMNEGITLVNTVEDHTEDAAEGLRTWSYVFGASHTLVLATAFTAVGILCPIALLVGKADGSWLLVVAVLVAAGAIAKVTVEVDAARRDGDGEVAAKRHGVRLARWFVLSRYPLILAGLIALV